METEAKEQSENKLTANEIAMHNEEVNARIAELEKKKQKYEDAKAASNGINEVFTSLSESANDINTLLQQIIVNKEPIGNNVFSETVRQQLSSFSDTFTSINGECDRKIEEIEERIKAARLELW